jgi:hypothetical protein
VSAEAVRAPVARRGTAGRWVLIATGVLLLANGLWLATAVGTPAVFAQDTGAALTDVRAAFPGVVDVMRVRGILIGAMLVGIGALLIVLAAGGLRRGPDAARAGLIVIAVLLATLAAIGFAFESTTVGSVYLVFALAAGAGVALTSAPSR